MDDLLKLKKEFLIIGQYDYIGLWQLINEVEERFKLSDYELKEFVLELIVCNTPFGKRLGEVDKLKDLYISLGDFMILKVLTWLIVILILLVVP